MGFLRNYGLTRKSKYPDATGGGINVDAWNRQKVINDVSLLHGLFTFNVPLSKWKEKLNGVETPITYSTSVDGKLVVSTTDTLDDEIVLETFRHPRYQSNRGHLYSSSIFLPAPTADGIRDFGFFTDVSGAFFRLKSDGLYACIQTYKTGTGVIVIEQKIDESALPEGIDFSKGNIYDIQMQWRGVGNIFFFIGEERNGINELVHVFKNMNLNDDLSMYNPANPIAFRCINKGDTVEIHCGCVDVSTEGGARSSGDYGSIGVNNQSGQIALTGYNVPVLAVRSKQLIGSLPNTRDTLVLNVSSFSDQKSLLRVWHTRDSTALTLNSQVWSDYRDGHLEKIIYGLNANGTALVGTPMSLNIAKCDLLFSARSPQDASYSTSALFENRSDIYQTPGDIFIFTLHRENGSGHNGGVTYEFAEEI